MNPGEKNRICFKYEETEINLFPENLTRLINSIIVTFLGERSSERQLNQWTYGIWTNKKLLEP